MKKIIIYVLVLVISLNIASALDCQYKVNEPYTKWVNNFYLDGNELDEQSLDIESMITVRYPCGMYMCGKFSIEIVNKYTEAIDANIYFKSNSGSENQQKSFYPGERITISAPATLDQNSVRFNISSPSGLESRYEQKSFDNYTCKLCPSGSEVVCLNDGMAATSDGQCGSGIVNVAGFCSKTRWVEGDKKKQPESGENCVNSPSDMKCDPHYECRNDIEECKPQANNPPVGMYYHKPTDTFRKIGGVDIGGICLNDDRDCKGSVCYHDKCQRLMEPKLRCPSGTAVKRTDQLFCNIYASNVLLGKDVKATFRLEAGSGLSFSGSEGCSNIQGSQCIGTYDVSSLSNKGISVVLSALAAGKSQITGDVNFKYKNKQITENVPPVPIIIYECGDGNVDPGETKQNCCQDVKVEPTKWYKLRNEICLPPFSYKYNWLLIISLVVVIGYLGVVGASKLISELTKLTKAKQEEIAKSIEKIDKEIRKKQKEVEMDEKLIQTLQHQKEKEEELEIVKERIKDSTQEIHDLRKKERKEKEKLKEGRLKPFTNKQGYKVIINDHGYEQFAKNLKYPEKEGGLFHRWYARKNIYYKNRHKYPLHFTDYEVHHKDNNKRNNDLDNLEILTREEHKQRHNL